MSSGPNKRVTRTTNRFSEVPKAQISRSTFNRSHGLKATFDAGLLIPIYVDEVLPGDTFSMSMNAFARLATPLHPTMDNLYLDSFFFFVPHRLVWDNFQKFMGEQTNPGDSTDYTVPKLTNAVVAYNDIGDYMGLAPQTYGSSTAISALPFRAEALIWNEWFRDQNLQPSLTIQRGDANDDYTQYALKRRGKRHDYFTSALPWPQKGDAVTIPLGDSADVRHAGAVVGDPVSVAMDTASASDYNYIHTGATLSTPIVTSDQPPAPGADPSTRLYVDLSSATATSINTLRQAFQVQKLLERDARGGTRYTEIIKAQFNVISSDARLMRPEYLGGGTTMIQVNPVAQTNATASDVQQQVTPQGNLAAVGTASVSGHGFHKSFTEHGTIIGLISARADLTYQQGLERMWSRRTRLDFFWPALQHIGEQAILNSEIHAYEDGLNNEAFGYQERYGEYRYKPSRLVAQFRSNHPQTLDSWHYAQDFGFATRPVLNGTFIEENPPIDRTIAVQDEPHFLLDAWFNLKCARPMPVYGVPGLIDHF